MEFRERNCSRDRVSPPQWRGSLPLSKPDVDSSCSFSIRNTGFYRGSPSEERDRRPVGDVYMKVNEGMDKEWTTQFHRK